MIVSLENYVPLSRFDAVAWTQATIQQSAFSIGPWVDLVTVNLLPLDTDPANPQARSFSVNGTITEGWYRIIFKDGVGNTQEPTLPQHNIAPVVLPFAPTPADIAELIRSRTSDHNSSELDTFTDTTRPSYSQVVGIIQKAVDHVTMQVGVNVPESVWPQAKDTVALYAAMLIELSYWPEQTANERGPFAQLKELYRESIGLLQTKVEAVEAELNVDDSVLGAGMPNFSFPSNALGGLIGYKTRM